MKARKFLLIFTFFLIFVLYAWVSTVFFGPDGYNYIRHASHLLAVMGFVFIFMQFILSSRIKLIEEGFGLDRMLNYHRYFGRIGLFLVILHALLIFVYQLFAGDVINNILSMWAGIIALIGFTVTAALAAAYKKLHLAYEIWKNVHLLNYVLFPVALIHIFLNALPGSLLYYLWVALASLFAALILYRIYRIIVMHKNPYTVVDLKQESDDIWSVYFTGKKIAYKPGQFLMIQLQQNGRLSSSHPFTISSSPTRDKIAITPKELGDFTATIKDTRVGDKALIDAPYGIFSFLNYAGNELVFIAGGIGITPFMSMLRYLHDQQLNKKVTLFWSNKNEKNLCFQDELAKLQKEMHGFRVVLVMSGQQDWPGEQGRISGKLVQKYLDLNNNDQEFFICGPPPMSKAAQEELKKLNIPAHRIHREVFEF